MDDDLALLEAQLSERIGQVLAERYRVDALLGIGGMGAVFKGFHLGLRRTVAIKVLHPMLARQPQISQRFDREAHSVSRLEHPNCVQVMDFGTTEDGTKYLVMQYLEGHELEATLRREGAMPIARAVELILQILRGLAHAHRQGVAHRDLKPENVFVTTDHAGAETLKLLDFGISKITSGPGDDKLTRAGLVFGTPEYMSPEQALGQPSDHRADIYAAGILLFRMLTGAPPFVADDPVALIRMQVSQPLPPLPDSVPAWLADLVARITAKSADERIASADEIIAALEDATASAGTPTAVASPGLAPSPSLGAARTLPPLRETMSAIGHRIAATSSRLATLPPVVAVVDGVKQAPPVAFKAFALGLLVAAAVLVVYRQVVSPSVPVGYVPVIPREVIEGVAAAPTEADTTAPAPPVAAPPTPDATNARAQALESPTRRGEEDAVEPSAPAPAAPPPPPKPHKKKKAKKASSSSSQGTKKKTRNCEGFGAIARRECWR